LAAMLGLAAPALAATATVSPGSGAGLIQRDGRESPGGEPGKDAESCCPSGRTVSRCCTLRTEPVTGSVLLVLSFTVTTSILPIVTGTLWIRAGATGLM